jgi:hypothetical protein
MGLLKTGNPDVCIDTEAGIIYCGATMADGSPSLETTDCRTGVTHNTPDPGSQVFAAIKAAAV